MITNIAGAVRPVLRLISAMSVLFSCAVYGQELEPRAFANLPVGMNFLLVGYAQSRGDLSTDPAVPIEDAELDIKTGLLAYARALDLFGKSGKVDVILPYSDLYGTGLLAGELRKREVSGFGDARVRLSMNFYGAPALSPTDFRNYRQDLIIGGSMQLTLPSGQYDPDRLINLGSNRWSLRTDVGLSKRTGQWTGDISVGASIFTDNDDFFGGQRLEQKPLYTTQANLSYEFPGQIWVAVGFTYYWGGQTTVDGDTKDDKLGNSRVGLTLSLPIDRQYSIKFHASTGVVTRIGTGFDIVGAVLQYRWGGGI